MRNNPDTQQRRVLLSSERERAADHLRQAAREAGVSIRDLDQRTYRSWWLRRPYRCHMPTDISILFGTWDEARKQAQDNE